MFSYLAERIFFMIVTVFFITIFTFTLMNSVKGGPFDRERPIPPEIKRALEAKYDLDKPLFYRYVKYMKDLAKGDFGPSFQWINRSVNELIFTSLPYTLKLAIATIACCLIFGVVFGIISALNRGKMSDFIIRFFATLMAAIPNYVLGPILIFTFVLKFNLFNVHSNTLDSISSMVLPVLSLSVFYIAVITRLMRSSMLDCFSQDYIKTARAKGLSYGQVIRKHAFKNAITPVIAYIGPLFAAFITGSFVIERMYAIPGVGRFFVDAITNRDYTMIMGMTIIYSVSLLLMNLMVDLIYLWLDPRIQND